MLWEFLCARAKCQIYEARAMDTTYKRRRPKDIASASASGLDGAAWTKFIKEIPEFWVDEAKKKGAKKLATSLDIIHAHRRSTGSRGMTAPQFGRALRDLARIACKKVTQYRRARGEAAQVLALLYNLIFTHKATQSWQLSLSRAAVRRLHGAAFTIQNWIRRRKGRHARFADVALMKAKILDAAVANVQKLVRRMLARRVAARQAQLVYKKFIDPESGYPYYYNERTGTNSWERPALLGHLVSCACACHVSNKCGKLLNVWATCCCCCCYTGCGHYCGVATIGARHDC